MSFMIIWIIYRRSRRIGCEWPSLFFKIVVSPQILLDTAHSANVANIIKGVASDLQYLIGVCHRKFGSSLLRASDVVSGTGQD